MCAYSFSVHSPFSIDTFITRIFPFLALPNTLANCSLAKMISIRQRLINCTWKLTLDARLVRHS